MFLSTHQEQKVVKNACMTLASLAEADGNSIVIVLELLLCILLDMFSLQLIEPDDEGTPGLATIAKSYKEHVESADVVETICTLLSAMAESEEAGVREELAAHKIANILGEIKVKYASNKVPSAWG